MAGGDVEKLPGEDVRLRELLAAHRKIVGVDQLEDHMRRIEAYIQQREREARKDGFWAARRVDGPVGMTKKFLFEDFADFEAGRKG